MFDAIPNYVLFLIGMGFGALIGSFFGAAYYRLPRRISIFKPDDRSECTTCHHLLSPADNIPLLSYLFLRGRCRYCKEKISPHYFIIELVTAIALGFLAVYSLIAILLFLFVSILIVTLISVFTSNDQELED